MRSSSCPASRHFVTDRALRRTLTLAIACGSAILCGGALQSATAAAPAKSPTARLDVVVPKPPTPVRAGGSVRLLYELRIENDRDADVELDRVAIVGDGRPLATLAGAALAQSMHDAARIVRPGGRATVFVDLAIGDVRAPVALAHRIDFTMPGSPRSDSDSTAPAPTALPAPARPLAGPPLSGGDWVALNGLANPAHRRALLTVDGRTTVAQRFAIDWIRLAPDGRWAHGDARANASWAGYGADVLAVGDAVVVEAKDGVPENVAGSPAHAVPITLDTATGNHIVLDLGDGRFATYAHLKPGSLRVAAGDRVTTGQLLAKLGNSGNSDAPHLHFHVTDGRSPLGSEGIPYVLARFTQIGIANLAQVEDAWRPARGDAQQTVVGEFPVDGAVVRFP